MLRLHQVITLYQAVLNQMKRHSLLSRLQGIYKCFRRTQLYKEIICFQFLIGQERDVKKVRCEGGRGIGHAHRWQQQPSSGQYFRNKNIKDTNFEYQRSFSYTQRMSVKHTLYKSILEVERHWTRVSSGRKNTEGLRSNEGLPKDFLEFQPFKIYFFLQTKFCKKKMDISKSYQNLGP